MTLQRSPLDAEHRALGATMVEFGGWEMPIAYPSGTIDEHLACRNRAVMFDVSHLGTVRVEGPDAYERLLIDVINGDQALFIRSDEIEQSWRWTDSLRARMRDTPLYLYARNSWGPFAADDLFGSCEGKWVQG